MKDEYYVTTKDEMRKLIPLYPGDEITVRLATSEECRKLGLPEWSGEMIFAVTRSDGHDGEEIHQARGHVAGWYPQIGCDHPRLTHREGVSMIDPQDSARRREAAREVRRRELGKMSKAELCRMYRRGVRTPEGRTVAYGGGMHPPEQWRKDEVISSILGIEYPAPEVNR